MKRAWCQVVVAAVALARAGLVEARERARNFKLATPAQAVSESSASLKSAAAAVIAAEPADASSPAVQAVIRFLELSPEQVEVFLHLLEARQEALAPLLAAVAEHEKALRELLESDGAPADVGQVVIEIHALEKQVAQVQAGFLANWANLLAPEQRQPWETARVAARLQPIVPAFQRLNLL